LARCAHCGSDPLRLLDARLSVQTAVEFLRGNTPQARTIMPSLTYEAGVLDALDWVLGLDDQGLFQKHLDSLASVRARILALH
jgi:hypothetical protein